MGQLARVYFSVLAVFLMVVLAGCSLEIATGSVRFLNEEEAGSPDESPDLPQNGENLN